MGVDLYTDYIGLQKRIASNTPGWAKELEDQGNPSVVVDNVDPLNADLSATLLGSRGYRCVWFDPIASVFVHESSTQAVRDHAVDFLARHFAHQADAAPDDPATFKAYIRALRGVATQMIRFPGSGDAQRRALILLGLDYVRRLREVDPTNLDGWKQAGLLESLRDPLPGEAAIPRFRMPFDPTIDLTLIRASSFLNHGLEIAPDDGLSLLTLAQLDLARGLDEAALPLYARYLDLTSVNESQRNARVIATDRIAELSRKLGQAPSLRWDNLGELETLVDRLLAAGRAGTAADLIERHFRPGSIPWSWAERLATIRLHLGQPVLARKAIEGANATAPPALRAARLAVASLAEADLESARRHYREALTIDPTLFEAHYGLALLEQDAGDADAALREARLAEKSASTRNTQEAARQIAARVAPYVARKAEAR
jgi:tetratricopeptide (TPR) repeat protein